MANHCSNYAVIYGSEDSIKQIMDRFSEVQKPDQILWWETFHHFFEIPLKKDVDVYKEFGSKWFNPETNECLDGDESTITVYGSSAWSPVIEFFRKISEKYNVRVEGEYDEEATDFGGFYEIENGEITIDQCVNYISYRYLDSGVDGVYSELEWYLDEGKEGAISRLNDAKGVMSEQDYNKVKEWINLHN